MIGATMKQTWTTPTLTEIDMSAEIGSYQEDFDPSERDFAAPKAPEPEAKAERAES
jgi:hypothetical protein